ncbi:preprotein translocase subunit SecA [Clostridium acetobutylicum]|uniref:Protein translocase subunit SecA n=1 Tax=Clostridium acetobutylicum (strain ATCC 824 / DSM 792 / JCM 1419 / IAM 19013 / LMG 5710 / NBRC 13948 / NRRL B-527 / VKM B-1787 / 2291 / W) TaxID=272562 RepID=SECA_CLOAB|nr:MULTISPECIES: preprotein translocase subunit SecA [Clostridium]Q97F94.1 RecName: Full=Protein translocase subunit SecA [Clostridium acetobutylicum ATCC 824]AAK80790.1 Preprotein translocase subunit SecA (ATPase, RNA helicase) [Clostridium acetobutylicum ATCC 824]ADZ21891.1 preprotein translocase subunit SecA [Clostridium acetobutylicum EA 2018]AEI34370.1 preprotein translocase subunit SecA [Clostridium acetobutylicum DSM 1731]AWV78798.1 preprotein translocase subunit SecA [Clostridium aceto
MGLLEKIFGTYSDREVKRIIPLVDKIDALDGSMQALSEDELKAKTAEFKQRYENGETLDDLLVEAFAVVREASSRILGLKHFREQIIGGIVLHQGRISEMKTGEGKTLVATLPSYLNAITGKGVHVVTVNDYLAKRDMEWMGQLYQYLGLTTGVIVHDLDQKQRQEAYAADITYGTNNEFGFDYLRDNMVIYKEERVQRPLHFCIVDEVDSILIDEARTPLIISGEGEKSTEFYKVADNFAKMLRKEKDFTIDEKTNSAILTDEGVEKAEKYYHIDNYADPQNMEIQHHTSQALKANYLMKRDKDYMVKEDEVVIVDEFTGRLMEGRRYSDGLHQAIEAKEGVKVQKESKTLATITFQNYFRMYEKLSGMTGTALTEEVEFREIYGLDVVVIPTHRPIARIDAPDIVYKTELGKFKAVVEDIVETNKNGQPVLVGTVSIEKSELLSSLLKKRGVRHQVLNAKYHEQEAEIISHAGEKGMVTIATNMAGRGTDIKLGEGVTDVGGLKIIGTERHESRRIDNQLRGRAGRQGDKGYSRFYVSLEDDLMRIFGSDKLKNMVEKLGLGDDDAIESKMVSSAIENAQKKVEGNNFDIRKTLIQYDDVMNKQREIIYKQRSEVLEGENLKDQIEGMIKDLIYNAVNSHISGVDEELESDIEAILNYLDDICLPRGIVEVEELATMSNDEIKEKLYSLAKEIYERKEEEFSSDQMRELERVILLRVVDTKWMDHIDSMEHLKQGIGLRAYKQQDPTQAYQMEGSDMFEEMVENIKVETVRYLFHVQAERAPERQRVVKETEINYSGPDAGDTKKEPVRRKEKKIGRNDLCPCGSGKKYKDCCGRRA